MTSTPKPTPFTIPSHSDAVLYNRPDLKSVLVHSQPSSYKQYGFRAILCFDSKPLIPTHLGLPELDNYEDKVFLQVAGENQGFILQSQQAPHHWMMEINTTDYIVLLQFINREWNLLTSKLNYQLKMMREGTEPIRISNQLAFYNHGSSYFKTNISSHLVLKAWIESGDGKGIIHCCLEKMTNHGGGPEEFMILPMESLTTLAQDALGMKAMTDILVYYKSRVKK